MFRSFDGVDDSIDFSPGSDTVFAFGTVAAIVLRQGSGAWRAVLCTHTGAGAGIFALEFTDANVLGATFIDASPISKTTTTFSNGQLILLVVTKATGTSTLRFHWYDYTTKAWTHQDGTTAEANGTATIANWAIGRYTTTDPYSGSVAVVGVWHDRTFTDAQIEELGLHAGINYWRLSNPSKLYVLDQSAVGQGVINEMADGGHQSSIVGTAVDVRAIPQFIGR